MVGYGYFEKDSCFFILYSYWWSIVGLIFQYCLGGGFVLLDC